MAAVIKNNTLLRRLFTRSKRVRTVKNLSQGYIDVEYIVKGIETSDEDMKNFLFTLGCYEGESITIISKLAGNFVVSVKDARYSIDEELAKAIQV